MRLVTSWIGFLVLGLALVGAGIGYHQFLAARAADRVASGEAVAATVTEVIRTRGTPNRMVVEYHLDDEPRRQRLAGPVGARLWEPGDALTVYVDPDAGTVTTPDGYTDDDWRILAPPVPLAAFGAVFAALALRHPVRTWRESRQRARRSIHDVSVTMDLGEDASVEWDHAYRRLVAQVTAARRRRRVSPVALRVSFLVTGVGCESGAEGAEVSSYDKRRQVLTVSVALPPQPADTADRELRAGVRQAVTCGEAHLRERGRDADLRPLWRIVDELSLAARPETPAGPGTQA
ncbi:DUF3592 domain-containing protein [Natronosporangium hydrolyticum]|uniref:DUF3592 domain-containing protein n=1 Tax=Natronosporangium hydrolyticum TaxID=2811111 RepID=A0A895YJZ6_9ACTN|nr:DUF3592 domain-containing protein [Natronosporangium hydrolyticum]QSB14430.1 DUF3592 domain-containing protein [Natronosporangium hydrolyticum]